MRTLKRYIAFARKTCSPRLSTEACPPPPAPLPHPSPHPSPLPCRRPSGSTTTTSRCARALRAPTRRARSRARRRARCRSRCAHTQHTHPCPPGPQKRAAAAACGAFAVCKAPLSTRARWLRRRLFLLPQVRQLEALVRISESHAKMRLDPVATADDVTESRSGSQTCVQTCVTRLQLAPARTRLPPYHPPTHTHTSAALSGIRWVCSPCVHAVL